MKILKPRFLYSRRGVAILAGLLLILFLFRPGVHRLRNRIATSIGSAMGRRVAINNVRLRILPRPGFDLEGLVIYDDPAFSAEPMIRAQEVSAAIRFRSLLRGRIEIATLSANEPSINLVRSDQGRWNLAGLLERNSQIPAAPTGKPPSERRPAFPYLEATHARINFKVGQTKKSYALMDADVALWQDSENSWGARLKAAPVRTDFNLTDTGLLQINATWQRASSLRSTPLQLAVEWQNGQLGQITKLLSGRDRGWRGAVSFTANVSGTPEALLIQSQTAIEQFRRYDIVDSESIRLATSCSAQYDAVTTELDNVLCESPVGGGTIRLRGSLSLVAQMPNYDLRLELDQAPLSSVVRLLRQAKRQVPADLTATGLLNAEFYASRNPTPISGGAGSFLPQWTGSGSATDVRLASNSRRVAVTFGTIPLTMVPVPMTMTMPAAKPHRSDPFHPRIKTKAKEDKDLEPPETHLRVGSTEVSVNASPPVNAGGWISATGYRFFLRGDAELNDVFRLEAALGLPVAKPAAEGSAKLDISVSGPWQGFAVPATLGTAQLHDVHAEIHGLNTPIEIGSATMTFAPDEVLLQKISARTGTTRWSGEITWPRHCVVSATAAGVASSAPACVYQFDLAADQLSTADLAEWFTQHPAKRPWYRILNSNTNSNSNDLLVAPPLLAIQAHGDLRVGRFGFKSVLGTQIATQVDVERGKITLTALSAQLLQGTHQGNWVIDLSNPDTSTPDASSPDRVNQSSRLARFHGTGVLRDISLEQVSALMKDAWITGTADGQFDLEGSGDNLRELLARSEGKLHFVMRNGSLPHVEIPGAPAPLPVHRFSGDLHLKNSSWKLSAGRLESRDGIYQVSGTVSADSEFDCVLTRGDELSWTLTGTLADPQVTPNDQRESNRAQADPQAAKP